MTFLPWNFDTCLLVRYQLFVFHNPTYVAPLFFLLLINRCLSKDYMEYLSSPEDTPWTPYLEYYRNVIGRLVDSILLMLNWFSFTFACFSKLTFFNWSFTPLQSYIFRDFFISLSCAVLTKYRIDYGQEMCSKSVQHVQYDYCLFVCFFSSLNVSRKSIILLVE